jgi:hypothetical protein
MAVNNLRDKTNENRSDSWHTAMVKEQLQAGKPTLEYFQKEN